MIRLRLTTAMQAIVADRLDRSARRRGPDAFEILAGDLAGLQLAFETFASGDGTAKREALTARHAAKRCAAALERARERRERAIPVTITVDEKESIQALASFPSSTLIRHDVSARLLRRSLIESLGEDSRFPRWGLSERGRAVVNGTPPGDLVPAAFFADGARVQTIRRVGPFDADVQLDVFEAVDGMISAGTCEEDRVWIAPGDVYVVSRP